MRTHRALRLLALAALATWAVGPMRGTAHASTDALASTYSVSAAPSPLPAGSVSQISVTLTNSGATTWPESGSMPVHLGVHFAHQGGGYGVSGTDATWVTNQRFALPGDVAPGQSVTLTAAVSAPTAPGTYVLEYQAVQENVAWFPQFQDASVTVTTSSPSVQYSAPTMPTPVPSGPFAYTISITNTSGAVWPAGGSTPVHLGLHFALAGGGYGHSGTDATWLTNQRFSLPADLAPGQTVTLTVSALAPATPGTYVLEAQMVQETVAWLPAYQDTSVQVVSPRTASYAVSGLPSTATAGSTMNFSVTVTNTGSATWTAGTATPFHLGVHVAARGGGYGVSGTGTTWYVDQRYWLPSDVAPGQAVTLSIALPLPSAAGTYVVEEEMVQENVAWFVQYQDSTVVVTSATGGSSIALGAYVNENGNSAPQSLSALDAYASNVGHLPAIVLWYQQWGGSYSGFPTGDMNNVISRGAVPEVTWEPWNGVNPDPAYKLTNIVAGNFDTYIRQWAQAAKAWGRPFYLRFGHEMNGQWYPWGTGSGNPEGNTPGDYVAAWRHIHDIFAQVGATNAIWVWCPNRNGDPSFSSYASDYPGDAYVDRVAFDAYNRSGLGSSPWKSVADLFTLPYQSLEALTNKPIMVGETASTEIGGDKAAWITQGFLQDLPTLFPKIVAVNWFDSLKETDWRVDSSPASLAAWRQVVASPLYQGKG